MEDSIYYYQDQWLHGPVSAGELAQMVQSGALASDTPVWRENAAAWLTARYLLEFAATATDETPLLSAKINCPQNLPPPRLLYVLRASADQNILTTDQCQKCISELLTTPSAARDLAEHLRECGLITASQAADVSRLLQTDLTQQIIGGYEILEKIGGGATGTTYKARQISLDRVVALKVLALRFSRDQMFVSRFFREAKLAAKLDHENIAAVYAVGVSGESHFIVMEYIDGLTLAQMIKARGRLPETEAINYLVQIVSALDYAYTRGILHRDISCQNIMISALGHPKLIDLGLAKETGVSRDDNTASIGTPAYMSPEQALDRHNFDIRSDIYSLGCVFYQMLCGHPPFEGESAFETIAMHLHQNVPEITVQTVSIGTRAIVRKMTRREISQRYQSVSDLLYDLNNVQQVAFAESLLTPDDVPSIDTQLKNSVHQDKIEIAIPGNGREYLRLISAEIDRRLDTENAPVDFHGFVQSMFAELTNNAFDHGIIDGQGLVYIRLEFNPAFFRVEVEDSGEGFNAKELFRELRTKPRARGRESGLAHVAQIADLLEYNKKGNKAKAVIYRREQESGIISETHNGALFIEVVGSGSAATNDEFCRFVGNYSGGTNVCLSVRVNWVSSLFVGAMVELADKVNAAGAKMSVWIEHSGCVRIVKQLGVNALLDIFLTRAAAIAAIAEE